MNMQSLCKQAVVMPVLVVQDESCAVPLAQALVRGGLCVLEVTLRTECALSAIRRMNDVEGAIVGAGTVRNADDVAQAKQAGAHFVVSPGATDTLLTAVHMHEMPILPGAASATEIMHLAEQGFDTVKFFPAEIAGGVAALQALYAPLPDITFCPTGGVNPHNSKDYLALPNVVCVGGSWIAPDALVRAQAWDEISARAAAAKKERAARS